MLALMLSFGGHAPARAGAAVEIGVIQYNAKAHNGGWSDKKPWDALGKQLDLIATTIHAEEVDFVTLDQAGWPMLAAELASRGLPNWTTVVSKCTDEPTQLSFSPNWTLIQAGGATNPIVDGPTPEKCWDKGRPYNIAYLHDAKKNIDVLFVLVHFPHCPDLPDPTSGDLGCLKRWNIKGVLKDAAAVVGPSVDLKNVHFIASGDMNELGGTGDAKDFAPIFGLFGALEISPLLNSCCYNSSWIYQYDHVVANGAGGITAAILPAPYPLGDPNYHGSHDAINEEHKAIYAKVKF